MKTLVVLFCTILMTTCNQNNSTQSKEDLLKAMSGNWTVIEIKGVSNDVFTVFNNAPTFNVNADNVSGTTGCNRYFAKLTNLTENTVALSQSGVTKMLCSDMRIPNAFSKMLNQISSYAITNDTLTFFNADKAKILVLKK